MKRDILEYIKDNNKYIRELIEDKNINTVIELVIARANIKIFLEIRDKEYNQLKINSVVFSKIFKIIKVNDKIGILRESYDYKLYEWLGTKPSNEDIKLVGEQIKKINNLLKNKKIDKLENIWIKKVNKGFPVIIKGVNIKHNGYLIGLLNFGKKRISLNRLNLEIRYKNLSKLYSRKELEIMYSNILNIVDNVDIYRELIQNNIDNELILRRLDCDNIAKLF
jgi:hypothetical protein